MSDRYINLYNLTIDFLKKKGLVCIKHDVIEYTCRYYYTELSRSDIYNELKKIFNKQENINAILMLVSCLKDNNKTCFPNYEVYCSAMKEALYSIN
jgi:hypothetical protein